MELAVWLVGALFRSPLPIFAVAMLIPLAAPTPQGVG
jgi:hypothetical protein